MIIALGASVSNPGWALGFSMIYKNFEGTHGFEPWTYRTAADCSTTELYPQGWHPVTTKAK